MGITREFITGTAKETQEVGERLARTQKRILCLYGDLGSGKTTFAQGYARGLGITSRLLSPTFIIVRRYKISQMSFFYHIDLYRLHSQQEIEGLGIKEIFYDTHARIIIEWSERLKGLMPSARTDIYFKALQDGRHSISITQ